MYHRHQAHTWCRCVRSGVIVGFFVRGQKEKFGKSCCKSGWVFFCGLCKGGSVMCFFPQYQRGSDVECDESLWCRRSALGGRERRGRDPLLRTLEFGHKYPTKTKVWIHSLSMLFICEKGIFFKSLFFGFRIESKSIHVGTIACWFVKFWLFNSVEWVDICY